MVSILRSARVLFQRRPWPPLRYPTAQFEVISDEYLLNRETLGHYCRGWHCTVEIGDTFNSRYQVIGKLS